MESIPGTTVFIARLPRWLRKQVQCDRACNRLCSNRRLGRKRMRRYLRWSRQALRWMPRLREPEPLADCRVDTDEDTGLPLLIARTKAGRELVYVLQGAATGPAPKWVLL